MKDKPFQAPHATVKSPDLTVIAQVYKTSAPKKGYSRFVSRGRPSMWDTDIKIKKVVAKREVKPAALIPVKVKKIKTGFLMNRREKGKFISPLIFDDSLINKMGQIPQVDFSYGF